MEKSRVGKSNGGRSDFSLISWGGDLWTSGLWENKQLKNLNHSRSKLKPRVVVRQIFKIPIFFNVHSFEYETSLSVRIN